MSRPISMLKVDDIDLYYGAAQALRGVSLTAEIGEISCVLGRNGVGKTSLLRAVTGHQPITRGRIEWEGRDLARSAPTIAPAPASPSCRRAARSSRC